MRIHVRRIELMHPDTKLCGPIEAEKAVEGIKYGCSIG